MSEGLFHIFNAITSVGCLLLGWGVFFHGRRFGSDVLLLRRFVAAVFTTQRKISEIADSCGYHDLPTFTRAFKRQFGMAPSTYREKNHD